MSIFDQTKSKFFSGGGTAEEVLSAPELLFPQLWKQHHTEWFHQVFAVTAIKEPDLIHSYCIWVENLSL